LTALRIRPTTGVLNTSGSRIPQADLNDYFSNNDLEICVDSDMSEVMQCKTLVHEIAHAFLHCKGGTEEKADQHTREVQAERIRKKNVQYHQRKTDSGGIYRFSETH
jgi:Zn-dependent peptidase ImmA (M78 family)